MFPRPADQIKILDFLSGQPVEQVVLPNDLDTELFNFLDSFETETVKHEGVDIKRELQNIPERRIYKLQYDNAKFNDYYKYLVAVLGLTPLLYYYIC